MTLCLAWRDEEYVHLASDSRLTLSGNGYIDVGIKTFEIPIKIFPPHNNMVDEWNPILETKLGLCFAGSALGAFLIKDTIVEFLKSLQYIPGITAISMENICSIVSRLHTEIVRSIGGVVGTSANTEFILTGYCPEHNLVECYSFYIDIINNLITSIHDRVLNTTGYLLLGSGQSYAQTIINNGENNMLRVLQKVINDAGCPSVGGFIQYGCINFEEQYFKIAGIRYTVMDDQGHLDSRFVIRGTDYFNSVDDNSTGFHVGYEFIDPFDDTPYNEI